MRTLMLLWMASFEGQVATQYVNEIEPTLKANRDLYLASPRTRERQRLALDYFDQQWNGLLSNAACGGAVLGRAGLRCIADRSRDGKWPWESYYRDPIAGSIQ